VCSDARPTETQQQTADAVGCSQQMVAKIDRMLTTKTCESQEKVVVPSWVTNAHDRAAFRKLGRDDAESLIRRKVAATHRPAVVW
jgi:hypothetical protein